MSYPFSFYDPAQDGSKFGTTGQQPSSPYLDQMPQVDTSGQLFAMPATSQPGVTPFTPSQPSGILPGDTYPGPSGNQPGSYFDQTPWSENYPGKPSPWTTPLGTPEVKDYAPFAVALTMTGSKSAQARQLAAWTDLQNALTITGPNGPIRIPKPPASYDAAGGYDGYIGGWRDTIDMIRRSLGLSDKWSPSDIDKLRATFDQLGIKYQMKDGKWSSRIYIPDGKGGYIQIDLLGGDGNYGFVNYGHTDQSMSFVPGYKPGSTATTGTGGSGGGSTGVGGGGGTGSTSDIWSQRANDLYNTLNTRANQSLLINRNDPIIRNQADAFAASQQRNRRDYLSEVAERAGPVANIGAERRSSSEKIGQNVSAFEANLMGTELKARRDEIAQALQSQQGLLTFEQDLALRQQLGLLDAAIRQAALAENGRQFDASLLQRAFEFDINDEFRRSPLAGGF